MLSEHQRIPTTVLDALEAARNDGRCNMLNRTRVISLCATFNYPEAVDWLVRNRDRYGDALAAMGARRAEQHNVTE